MAEKLTSESAPNKCYKSNENTYRTKNFNTSEETEEYTHPGQYQGED